MPRESQHALPTPSASLRGSTGSSVMLMLSSSASSESVAELTSPGEMSAMRTVADMLSTSRDADTWHPCYSRERLPLESTLQSVRAI